MKRRTLKEGDTLVEQGDAGSDLYLILDGVLAVEADGDEVAEVGPGNIVGEMALLQEEGKRTATLRARTPARVAVLAAESIDREALSELAGGREARGVSGVGTSDTLSRQQTPGEVAEWLKAAPC